jgi:serine/threonine-protein kinase
VTRTDPEAGRLVSRDRPIVVFVSKGEEITTVPDVRQMTLEAATAALEAAGLVAIDGGTIEVTDPALVGVVAEQNPAASESVPVGTEVTIKIGVLKQVAVPDFTGMSLDDAQAAGAALGITVVASGEITTEVEDEDQTVASQDPSAGTSVDIGTTITVVMYRYEEPTTTTTTTTT